MLVIGEVKNHISCHPGENYINFVIYLYYIILFQDDRIIFQDKQLKMRECKKEYLKISKIRFREKDLNYILYFVIIIIFILYNFITLIKREMISTNLILTRNYHTFNMYNENELKYNFIKYKLFNTSN